MGWQNPPIPWSELERKLSDRNRPGRPEPRRRRQPGVVRASGSPTSRRPTCCPSSSRLSRWCPTPSCTATPTSASSTAPATPRTWSPRRCGWAVGAGGHRPRRFYGVVRAAEAARAHGLRTVVGAELSLGLTGPQNGVADPEGTHLLVLARGTAGYHRLAAAITRAQLRGAEKGRPVYDLEELPPTPAGTGWCSRLPQGHRAQRAGRRRAGRRGRRAGPPGRAVRPRPRGSELFDHGHPTDSRTNDASPGWPRRPGCRWWPPATCTWPPPTGAGWPGRWPPSGRAAT